MDAASLHAVCGTTRHAAIPWSRRSLPSTTMPRRRSSPRTTAYGACEAIENVDYYCPPAIGVPPKHCLHLSTQRGRMMLGAIISLSSPRASQPIIILECHLRVSRRIVVLAFSPYAPASARNAITAHASSPFGLAAAKAAIVTLTDYHDDWAAMALSISMMPSQRYFRRRAGDDGAGDGRLPLSSLRFRST